MGNAQSLNRTVGALDSYVADLGSDVVYDKSLGSARFLKTVKCRQKSGNLVVKLYVKSEPGISLRNYYRRLKQEREALADIANVYNYQVFVETEKAGYIIRQWVASNLYDRISTRPFLSSIEKKWIAFQLLTALRDARTRKIAHGDVKSENVLVTSSNFLLLSDFSSTFKPTFLPLDDPADFSFYFDTSGRRTCYLAPERFYDAKEHPDIARRKGEGAVIGVANAAGGVNAGVGVGEGKRDGKVTEAMDCFGAGCVIAELFLEGAPLFTLSQLFKYREGAYAVDGPLAAIEDDGVCALIKQMISLDAKARPTFDMLLHTARGSVFPECFYSFMHNYVAALHEPPTQPPVPTVQPSPATPISATFKQDDVNGQGGSQASNGGLVDGNDADARVEKLWADYESVEPYLVPDNEGPEEGDLAGVDARDNTLRPFQDVFPVELHVPNRESRLVPSEPFGRTAATEDGPALIILTLVCANVRNCRLPSSKIRALDVFLALSSKLTDEAKLDRMVPYVVELLHDDAALVRAAALRTLVQVLMLVKAITPFNASIFPEYIFPNIAHLLRDSEVSVRCLFAQCIVALGDTAVRYLEMGQALKAHGAFKRAATTGADAEEEAHFEISYDASMQDLQSTVQEHLSALLMDPSAVVKRAVLHDIASICVFLGRQKTNDVLLSHMITYLNDRDWLLRYAFFDAIVDVAACAGGRSLEEYILPLMIQALSDVEESVVAKVLAALTSLCELGLFQKMRIWELMSATLGFLYHPNIWIRQGAAAFIASAAKHLPQTDVWCILYPSLRHFIKSDLRLIDERNLLTAVKNPLTRAVLDAAVQWAQKSDKGSFWKGTRRLSSKAQSPRESMIASRKGGAGGQRSKSDEDEAQFAKLRQLGMSSSEEAKLLALRDYIAKLADAISSFASRLRLEMESESLKTTGAVELQKLKVVPQTVFLKARADPNISSPRSALSRRTFSDTARSPMHGTPRLGRAGLSGLDNGAAPFEDLRRRLVTLNGSATSLNAHQPGGHVPRDARSLLSPVSASPLPTPALDAGPGELPQSERPGSPTDSVLSAANSSAFRPLHRIAGIAEVQKAAPAIGSSKANAVGVMDSASKIRSDGSPDRSGRSSPGSAQGITRPAGRGLALQPISTYDGQEPGISNVLEHLYLDSKRDLTDDFGPKVHEGPVRRRNPVRHLVVRDSSSTRRTEALLVAHLSSHSDRVNGVAVSPDHSFFVSGSDDRTVKVWDTARLERNVTAKPRHTYGQHHARVKCVCMLERTHCFASAADDGSLHVVRVHVSTSGSLPKYNKLQVVREHRVMHPGEYITCMAHFNTETASTLVYATTHSVITMLDLRTMRAIQTMHNPRHLGPITCLCLDRKRSWVIVGTATGVVSLWDIRFGLLLKNWRIGTPGTQPYIHQCLVHPTKGRGRWIVIALQSAGMSVEVWDIEKTALVEAFSLGVPSDRPKQETEADKEAEMDPATAIANLVRARQGQEPGMPGAFPTRRRTDSDPVMDDIGSATEPISVYSIAVGTELGGPGAHRNIEDGGERMRSGISKGFVLTGSEDRKIRLWDLGKIERSVVLSGNEPDSDRPSFSSAVDDQGVAVHSETTSTTSNRSTNRPPQRLSLINNGQQHLLRGHQDTVTALACVDSPFRGGVISGDRSGSLKVWRVEDIE